MSVALVVTDGELLGIVVKKISGEEEAL